MHKDAASCCMPWWTANVKFQEITVPCIVPQLRLARIIFIVVLPSQFYLSSYCSKIKSFHFSSWLPSHPSRTEKKTMHEVIEGGKVRWTTYFCLGDWKVSSRFVCCGWKKPKKETKCYLVSMAVSDLLVADNSILSPRDSFLLQVLY